MKIPMVDLPLGATEDRVCGTIDIEKALTEGGCGFDTGAYDLLGISRGISTQCVSKTQTVGHTRRCRQVQQGRGDYFRVASWPAGPVHRSVAVIRVKVVDRQLRYHLSCRQEGL